MLLNAQGSYEYRARTGNDEPTDDVAVQLGESDKDTPSLNNPQRRPHEAHTADSVVSEKPPTPEEGKTLAESSRAKRKSRKQKQHEDQNTQWLGDKVHLTTVE